MPIEFICPNTDCGKKLSISDDKAGKKIKCPGCKEVTRAPLQSGDAGATIQANDEEAAKQNPVSKIEPLLEARGVGLASIETESEIAQGGMGKVMLCHDKGFGRPIAMKVMLSKIAASGEHRLRFLEEAQITGQLEHPNIVPVHDLGKDENGNLYFTMKHVKGRSLGEILKQNSSADLQAGGKTTGAEEHAGLEASATRTELLNIFIKSCDAIAAHSKGVIHRDLKPDNIMVGDFGEVLVMDWGLAKVVSPGRAGSQPAPSQTNSEPAGSRRAQEGEPRSRNNDGRQRSQG
jgi:serine/threonine protein kinase/phage FluMu protein Com